MALAMGIAPNHGFTVTGTSAEETAAGLAAAAASPVEADVAESVEAAAAGVAEVAVDSDGYPPFAWP